MKKVLVTGAAGCIGSQLVKRLKLSGDWLRAVDLRYPEFEASNADEYLIRDLRLPADCQEVVKGIDEIYNLAADMGGVGYLEEAKCQIMRNNSLININMLEAAKDSVQKYFFSSSACVYPDTNNKVEVQESFAYPASPDNEYGWEKLYAERLVTAYGQKYGFETRIARFQNTFGVGSVFTGGREKAPAALIRKALEAKTTLEVWGDGQAKRNFIYIDDLLEGIETLMNSDRSQPTNIGTDEYVTINQLAELVIQISGKSLTVENIPGPVGVHNRSLSNTQIKLLGWEPKTSLQDGLDKTYQWIESWKA